MTKKADQSKKSTTKSKAKSTKSDNLSNKAVIYLAWKKGEEDIDKLHEKVDKAVKRNTVRGWVNRWKKGKGLPGIAKKKVS